MSLISFVFIQAIHLYSSWGSVLMFLFILVSRCFSFHHYFGKASSNIWALHFGFGHSDLCHSKFLRHKPAAEKTVWHSHGSYFDVWHFQFPRRMQLSWEVMIRETESIHYVAKASHMLAFKEQDWNTEPQSYSAGSQHWEQGCEWCTFDGQVCQALTGCCILQNRNIWKEKVKKK